MTCVAVYDLCVCMCDSVFVNVGVLCTFAHTTLPFVITHCVHMWEMCVCECVCGDQRVL